MAKKSKKNKQIKKEDAAVQELFEQCKSALTSAEFDSLTEGYECLKPFFVPGDYSEVAMTLLTTIYSRRKTAPDELVTLDKVINDTINSPLIAATVWGEIINSENDKWRKDILQDIYEKTIGDDAVCSRGIKTTDKYRSDENWGIVELVYEALKQANSERADIVLAIANGEKKEDVAAKCGKTVLEIDKIYNTTIERIKNAILCDDIVDKSDNKENVKK